MAFDEISGRAWIKRRFELWEPCTVEHVNAAGVTVVMDNMEELTVDHDCVKQFDLDKMDFDVPNINLNGLKLNLEQGDLVREIAVNTVQKTDSIVKARPDLNIKLGKIKLSKISVVYDNKGTQLNSGLSLDKLNINFKKSDLPKQEIIIDNDIDDTERELAFIHQPGVSLLHVSL